MWECWTVSVNKNVTLSTFHSNCLELFLKNQNEHTTQCVNHARSKTYRAKVYDKWLLNVLVTSEAKLRKFILLIFLKILVIRDILLQEINSQKYLIIRFMLCSAQTTCGRRMHNVGVKFVHSQLITSNTILKIIRTTIIINNT